jgi:hypothetical protein
LYKKETGDSIVTVSSVNLALTGNTLLANVGNLALRALQNSIPSCPASIFANGSKTVNNGRRKIDCIGVPRTTL